MQANERGPVAAGFGVLSAISHHWSGTTEHERSPTMRAERAKLKSRRDDMIVASVAPPWVTDPK